MKSKFHQSSQTVQGGDQLPLIGQMSPLVGILQYNTNTNTNLYSAKFVDKNETEALGGQLGGKQVSFKFAFKCTVIITGSNTRSE